MAQSAAFAKGPLGGASVRILHSVAILLIDFYRALLSPLFVAAIGPSCRFEPTCSAYAREAIVRYGLVAGARMMARRLVRCRPAGGWGHDPVPFPRNSGAVHEAQDMK
jgi:uncharacterized protein